MGELEHSMTVHEFADWARFCNEHPLPMELADIHNAMQMALIANVNRGKDTPQFEARQFLVLRRGDEPRPKAGGLTIAQRMKAATKG